MLLEEPSPIFGWVDADAASRSWHVAIGMNSEAASFGLDAETRREGNFPAVARVVAEGPVLNTAWHRERLSLREPGTRRYWWEVGATRSCVPALHNVPVGVDKLKDPLSSIRRRWNVLPIAPPVRSSEVRVITPSIETERIAIAYRIASDIGICIESAR